MKKHRDKLILRFYWALPLHQLTCVKINNEKLTSPARQSSLSVRTLLEQMVAEYPGLGNQHIFSLKIIKAVILVKVIFFHVGTLDNIKYFFESEKTIIHAALDKPYVSVFVNISSFH